MAYTMTAQDKGVGKSIHRPFEDKQSRWAYARNHHFTTEVDASVLSINALIRAQADPRTPGAMMDVLEDRMGVIITNCDSADMLYVGFSSGTSSANFTYALAPGETTPFLPLRGNLTCYVIGGGADTITNITEFS